MYISIVTVIHCTVHLFYMLQGKRNLASQTSTSSARNSKGTDMKNIMANAIMGGGGTARERLRQRKGLAREQPQGMFQIDAVLQGSLFSVYY